MELPAEIVLSVTLKPGAVYLFKHDSFPDNHHFFVVLNLNVIPGEMLYLACASSQVQKRIDFVSKRGISKETLVILKADDFPFLEKETVFDCNRVHEVAYDVLKEKLDNNEVPSVEEVTDDVLILLRKAVCKSPMISGKIKKLLQ